VRNRVDIDSDLLVLRRIVATLLSLAALADCAAARPAFIRILFHWLLRTAERAALSLVVADVEAYAAPAGQMGIDPDELVALAASLRTLALLIAEDCLALAEARDPGSYAPPRLRPRLPAPVFAAVPVEDTS